MDTHMDTRADTFTPSDSGSDLSPVMDVDWPKETKKPAIKKQLSEDYAEIVRTGHNLRRRGAKDVSPYLSPWQQERRRREARQPKLNQMEYDDETEDDEKTLGKLAKVSLAGPPPPAPGFQMLLDAAALLGTNDISCTSFGCPIKGPHPEGLYRYPGPVPNSDLANEYFAPSIPPPAVVEAFNRIAGRPSLNDLHVKDYFFDYHTLPCRPSKHLPKVWKVPCKSQRCGVQGPHNKGAYLHDGLDASLGRAREVSFCFGISNPPPRVWEAALRIVDHTATAADNEHVDDFSAHHVRFDTEKGSTNAKPFQEWQKERMAARP